MGVTMHYVQYITITYKVIKKRKEIENKKIINVNYNYFIIIGIYASIMSILAFIDLLDASIFELLILVPILGQILHFYLDSFLWKFKDKHNREVTLKYIKN